MSKVLLSMPDELLIAIDKHCGEKHYERSEYLRFLLRKDLFGEPLGVGEQVLPPETGVVVPKVVEPISKVLYPGQDLTDDEWEEIRNEIAEKERAAKDNRITTGFCQNHFERGVVYNLVKLSYEDETGERQWTKDVCPKCLESLERETKQRGGKLIYI